jgi:mitosis inhibitor protein kinase SWE1
MTSKMSNTPFCGEKLRAPQFDRAFKANDENSAEKTLGVLPWGRRGRKSCPGELQFPMVSPQRTVQRARPLVIPQAPSPVDSLGSVDPSPTNARAASRQRTYGNVGLGRPSDPSRIRAQHLLLRRSSSGAFSTASSESSEVGTPTRSKATGTLAISFPSGMTTKR